MKRVGDAVRSGLGWLLLAACLLLLVWQAMPGKQTERLAVPATGRSAAVEAIPPPQGEVRVNTLDAEALTILPGIGPALAQAIVAERAQGGPFHYPEDLLAVRGIGQGRLEAVRHMLDLREEEP